jgi:hypothetical protein
LRFSAKFPKLKRLRRAQVFVKSLVCEGFMAAPVWRKRKGVAHVRLAGGTVHLAEIHWYEAAGIGRKEFKIKQLL